MTASTWHDALLDRLLESSWEILPWALLVFLVTRPQLRFRPATRVWFCTALAIHWLVRFAGIPSWEIAVLSPAPARSAYLESLAEPVPLASVESSTAVAVVMIVWALGACAVAAGWGTQGWRLRQLAAAARPVAESGWLRSRDRQQQALGLRTSVALRELPDLSTPLAIGLMRRQVILPAALVAQGSHSGGAWALAHELSHHARWDLLQSWFAAIACALFWFHPLAWWLASEQRKNQEEAADELAMQIEAVSAHQYGAWLLGWAQSRPLFWRGSLALASRHYRQLERRIRMLGLPPTRSTIARRSLFSAAILLSLVLLAPWRLVAASDAPVPRPVVAPEEVAVVPSPRRAPAPPAPPTAPIAPAPRDSQAFAALRLVERATELRVMAERLEAEARELLGHRAAHAPHAPPAPAPTERERVRGWAEADRARTVAESQRAIEDFERALAESHVEAPDIQRERERLARELERVARRQQELRQREGREQREREAPFY